MDSEFIFCLVNPGSENALKDEVEMTCKGWHPSYQRRGFVTFKLDGKQTADPLLAPLAYARRICRSLGKFASRDEALAKIREISGDGDRTMIHDAKFEDRKMRGIHPENPEDVFPDEGQVVGTIVQLGETEFWAGLYRHAIYLSPDPAGDGGLVMAEHSPSRAWLKLEEALRFFKLEIDEDEVVVELGCAPGGVVLALLDRGVSVVGVDPAKMAEVVTKREIAKREDGNAAHAPWFYHVRKPAALASKRDLRTNVRWFMSDMNQSPEVVLKECARFCKMAPSIRSVLVTLKLTDPKQIRDKQQWFDSLREMGFKTVRLQQFSVHHKELALLGLRSPGLQSATKMRKSD